MDSLRDRVAVVTGGGSGIGRALVDVFAREGARLVVADVDEGSARQAADAVRTRGGTAIAVRTDVTDLAQMQALADRAFAELGGVDVLCNNAGVALWGPLESATHRDWQWVLGVNLWGVIHGVQVFAPGMIAQKTPAAIVNTGSKQGITCPPGNTGYNMSKAGVKVMTEALAHELRSIEACRVTAHLLIPGFTYTGITNAAAKPAGAWTAEQVVDFMLPAMGRGDFYILCPDNEVTRVIDEKRIAWAAGDIVENRPALSRWHPGFSDAFATFMKS